MSYNAKYNTRNSGRYNTPGQFVPGGESQQSQPPPSQPIFQQNRNQNVQSMEMSDMEMKQENIMDTSNSGDASNGNRPHWMKAKLPGVKKVSNKERRRRQNENLRKLLSPKNALMALNEMMPHEQVTNQFKVELANQFDVNQYFNKAPGQHSFCADLTVNGVTYKGYGDNKLSARNAAAEQALRDLVIKKMSRHDAAEAPAAPGAPAGAGEEAEDEAIPMIQLASYALHKLFSEWEFEGHKVPQLKPTSHSTSECASEAGGAGGAAGAVRVKAPKKPKELPLNASAMHPCMLLTYMRPHMEYRELAVEGDRPQNMTFTLGVDVDGTTYIGKASNKKEARRMAAKAACQDLFGVQFDEVATANTPVLPQTQTQPQAQQ